MKFLTDEEVELEIKRLNATEEVRLARLEQRLRYRRRQTLYTLRQLEKRGKALMDAGFNAEILKEAFSGIQDDEEGDE